MRPASLQCAAVQHGSGTLGRRLDDCRIADLNKTFDHDLGYLRKDPGYDIFRIYGLDLYWKTCREFEDLGCVEDPVTAITGNAPENAHA